MTSLTRTLSALFLGGVVALTSFSAAADNRRNNDNRRSHNSSVQSQSRNSSHNSKNDKSWNSNHNNNNGSRPSFGNNNGNNHNWNNGNHNNGNHNNGNHNNGNNGNHNGNFKPNNNAPGQRPAMSNHVGPTNRPGNSQFAPGHNKPVQVVPQRPVRPIAHPISRPVPPPAFRPHYRMNPLQAILGFGFGTALNVSLNLLTNANYTINSYGNNNVFLNNVSAMNFRWPNATLYYTNGLLVTSVFNYSTPYNDASRYNSLFVELSNQYGAPVSVNRGGSSLSATWFGFDNRYITIEYQPQWLANGGLTYTTSLIMGN